jgi:polyphosphate kinase
MAYGHTDDEGYVSVAVKIFPDFDYLSAKEVISKDAENISAVLEDYYKKIIKEQVNKFLPQYKAVKKIFLRFREFDMTTTKKIKRNSEDNLND